MRLQDNPPDRAFSLFLEPVADYPVARVVSMNEQNCTLARDWMRVEFD